MEKIRPGADKVVEQLKSRWQKYSERSAAAKKFTFPDAILLYFAVRLTWPCEMYLPLGGFVGGGGLWAVSLCIFVTFGAACKDNIVGELSNLLKRGEMSGKMGCGKAAFRKLLHFGFVCCRCEPKYTWLDFCPQNATQARGVVVWKAGKTGKNKAKMVAKNRGQNVTRHKTPPTRFSTPFCTRIYTYIYVCGSCGCGTYLF